MNQTYGELLTKFKKEYLDDEPRWKSLAFVIETYLAQCRVATYEKTGTSFYYHILPVFNFEKDDYSQITKQFKDYKKLTYLTIDNRSGRRNYTIRFSESEHLFVKLLTVDMYQNYLGSIVDSTNTFYKSRSYKFTPLIFHCDLDNIPLKEFN